MRNEQHSLIPDPDERACFNCRAWCAWGAQAVGVEGQPEIKNEPTGQCRVRAPVAGKAEAFGARPAVWPVVAASDWCCEFKKGAE